MGAWAVDSFGNDDALDFLADLDNGDSLARLTEAFKVATLSEYIEAPDGCNALVAAEVVAAALGRPSPSFDRVEAAKAWLERTQFKPAPEMVGAAYMAAQRVLKNGNSELRELWAESADYEEWKADVEDLMSRLDP